MCYWLALIVFFDPSTENVQALIDNQCM